MARFDYERAATFGAYTVTALVRDAGERGRVFVRIARRELAEALGTAKLYVEHIEAVRVAAGAEGIAMSDMGTHFTFHHDTDDEDLSEPVSAKTLNHVTNHFCRLSKQAADASWEDQDYMPPRRTLRPKAEPAASRVVRKTSQTIRVRGAA